MNVDKSGANHTGIATYNADAGTAIEIRQDHRFVKQKVVAALGFQTFHTAKDTLTGLELVHMIRKGQIRPLANGSNADQFNALAA